MACFSIICGSVPLMSLWIFKNPLSTMVMLRHATLLNNKNSLMNIFEFFRKYFANTYRFPGSGSVKTIILIRDKPTKNIVQEKCTCFLPKLKSRTVWQVKATGTRKVWRFIKWGGALKPKQLSANWCHIFAILRQRARIFHIDVIYMLKMPFCENHHGSLVEDCNNIKPVRGTLFRLKATPHMKKRHDPVP